MKSIEQIIIEWEHIKNEFSRNKIREVTKGDMSGTSINCHRCNSLAIVVRREGEELILFNKEWANKHNKGKLSAEKMDDLLKGIQEGKLENFAELVGSSFGLYSPPCLDLYCNKCKKVYCEGCYHETHDYDEGFIESTYYICPMGHKRMVE